MGPGRSGRRCTTRGWGARCVLARPGRRGRGDRSRATPRLAARRAEITAAAYGLNYAVKLAVRRPRPGLEGLPALSPVVSRLSFPSAHATTSFAAARAFSTWSRRMRCTRPRSSVRTQPPLPRRPLSERRPRRRGAGDALATRMSPGRSRQEVRRRADEGRDRRHAQRREVLAVQRAHRRGRRGGQLPVHHHRAQRGDRARDTTTGSTPSPTSSTPPRSCPTRSPFTTSPGWSPAPIAGEGLGNQFLANIRETDAIVHVVRAHTDENVVHPEGRVDPHRRHRDDRDRADLRRPRAGRAPARAGGRAPPAAATGAPSPRRSGSSA